MLTTGSAADRAVDIYLQKHPPAGEDVEAYVARTSSTRDPLKVVRSYIPGDVLTGYLPLAALVVHVAVLVVALQLAFAVLTVIAVGIQLQKKLAKRKLDIEWNKLPRWPMIASVSCYIVFTATLPVSGFGLIPGFQLWYGTVAIGVLGAILEVLGPSIEKKWG